MNINKIAIDSIKSNTVKQYLNSINHIFSLKEQISLIFNSNLQLDKKKDIFNYIISKEDTPEDVVDELEIILMNIANFENYSFGTYDVALMFYDEDDEAKCIGNIEKLRDYIRNNDNKVDLERIHVVDLNTSEVKYYFSLNKELNITQFSPYDYRNEVKYVYNTLEQFYVDIPNEFKVGDIVKECGSDKKWVVVYESYLPEHLKSKSDFSDSCITVIPKSVLKNNSKSYKEQIEDIFKDRIKHMETDNQILDIISIEHEHLTLTLVERA